VSVEPGILIAGTVVLMAISWVLVATETAIGRVSRARLAEISEEHPNRASRLVPLADDPARYANSLLLCHTTVTITSYAMLSVAFLDLLTWSDGWVLLLSTGVMSAVVYVVLGVSARTFGGQRPYLVAGSFSWLTRFVAAVLSPLVSLFILLGNAITPGRGSRSGPFTSQAELRELVDSAGVEVIDDEERVMIHSVFALGGTIAREVMVPRTEMVSIESDKTLRQAMSLALRSGFSRIPVVGEGADDVVGVVFLKDVVRRIFQNRKAEHGETVVKIMRPVHYVPDTKSADDLLREMQADREHMGIVVDEYGGTAGLVTIEDILEEIVGEIDDEYDTSAPDVEDLGDGSLRVSARLSLEHFCEVSGVTLDADTERVETVGGLMGLRLGRVPIPGAKIAEQGLLLKAESGAGRRNQISTILVEPIEGGQGV
jgi:CBS domain containing-hemolysin-like protein